MERRGGVAATLSALVTAPRAGPSRPPGFTLALRAVLDG